MRSFTLTREFYVLASYQEILRDDALGVVVHADQAGTCAIGFSGKRQKPDFHLSFRSKERAEEHVARWLERIKTAAQAKVARREARKSEAHSLQVGDILRACWGYEQTNVDYYEVTAVIGKQTVEIREIACMSEDTGHMQGISVPAPGKFIGEPMRKRASADGSVKVQDWGVWARKKEAQQVAGVKVFAPDSWTAYA